MVKNKQHRSEGASARASDKRLTLTDRKIALSAESLQRPGGDFTVSFLEELAERDPSYEEALNILGHVYTGRGDYEKGLEMDRRLVRLRPDDPSAHYNLACSYSLLSQLDKARQALRRALELGFRPISKIEEDSDLSNLRASPLFEELMREYRARAHDARR